MIDHASLTDEQWQELLSEPAPVPRRIVRVYPDRRTHVLAMLAQGMKGGEIATRLGISPGLVSKIKKSER